MKQVIAILTALVLTLSLFTGCGCRNSAPANTTEATMPTMTTAAPTTEATTMPTTEATTAPTIQDGNGPLNTDSTGATDTTEATNARSRSGGMMGGTASGNGITGSIG